MQLIQRNISLQKPPRADLQSSGQMGVCADTFSLAAVVNILALKRV